MYRNIPVLVALSVVATNAAAFPADQPTHALRHTSRHLLAVSEQRVHPVPGGHPRREVVAMAPTEAEIDGWRVPVRAADSTSPLSQNIASQNEPASHNNFNVIGMLAAALGLGVMSIIRRMGRF
jgi:hypothetical protein